MKTTLTIFFLTAILLLAGCALTPEPDHSRFYTLPTLGSVESAQGLGAGGQVLGIMPITLPDYLQRPYIVLRRESGQVHWSQDVRWAETLEAGMARVLRTALERATERVEVRSFPRTDRVDYRLYLEVFRCEASETGTVFFDAQLHVDDARTGERVISEKVSVQEDWRRDDYSGFAEIISQSIEALVKRADWSSLEAK